MNQLEQLLQKCTLKLMPSGNSWGTGFFVAPGLILTCNHVVQQANGEPVQVMWQDNNPWAQAVVEQSFPDPYDLALLRVTISPNANPPCVYLDAEEIRSRDPLYLFGYPDQDFPSGCPTTFECEGLTGDTPSLIKFAMGQVRPGMSGSPLLNQRTGKVCGIVKFTRDRSIDLGGGAISSSIILEKFPQLQKLQQQFHQGDRRWSSLVVKQADITDTSRALSAEISMNQTNLDSVSYQTQTGANNKNFIGGIHHHPAHVAQPLQIAKKILMLSANPEDVETAFRRAQVRKIREALSRAKLSYQFELQNRTDIAADELSQVLSEIKPYIIDIYGCKNGIENLILQDELIDKIPKKLEELIFKLFKLHSKGLECVILNGCYLEEQAREIIQHIEFVIGISQNLSEDKILKFLNEFYYHLGTGRSIGDSYEAGCYCLRQKGLDDTQLPILLNKFHERKNKELDEKIKSCEKEIEKNKNDISLWIMKANLLKDLGHHKEADEVYEIVSSLEPENYKIRAEQGDTLEKIGKHEEAVNAYNKALELEEKDYKIWWKKGKALAEGKKYNEAIKSYKIAVELEPPLPDNYVICREYGSILMKVGQYTESVVSYKNSLKYEPKYRASNYEKKEVYRIKYSGNC
jgi:tetratricopeptide (TPR) repeat protein